MNNAVLNEQWQSLHKSTATLFILTWTLFNAQAGNVLEAIPYKTLKKRLRLHEMSTTWNEFRGFLLTEHMFDTLQTILGLRKMRSQNVTCTLVSHALKERLYEAVVLLIPCVVLCDSDILKCRNLH